MVVFCYQIECNIIR